MHSGSDSAVHSPSYGGCIHLTPYLVVEELKQRIDFAVRALQGHLQDFDAIAFRGSSGMLIGAPVAVALNKSMLLVRKTTANCHSESMVEGDVAARSYVILDDFRASGETQKEIQKEIAFDLPKARCIGLLEVTNISELELERYSHTKYRLLEPLDISPQEKT